MAAPFAFIITLDNRIEVIRVNPIYGRLFFVKGLGMYLLDEHYRYILTNGKAEIYFYTQLGINPISPKALLSIEGYLEHSNRKELEMQDLALFVDKIRKVEIEKRFVTKLQQEHERAGTPLTEGELQSMLLDGSLDFTVQKLNELAKPKGNEDLDDHAQGWLNAYFKEDIISRYYLNLAQIVEQKYKLKESKRVGGGLSVFSKTQGKKNIALIVINNSRLDIEPAKTQMNYDKGHYELITKRYDTFDIKEANTRYSFGSGIGRQNIFLVMVETDHGAAKKGAEPLAAAKVAEPHNGNGKSKTVEPVPIPATAPPANGNGNGHANQQAEPIATAPQLQAQAVIKRGRGRPRKQPAPALQGPVIDSEGAS